MFGKNISGWRFQTIRKYYCSDGVVSCQEGMQNKTVLKPLAKRPPLLPHVAVFLFQFTVLTHVKNLHLQQLLRFIEPYFKHPHLMVGVRFHQIKITHPLKNNQSNQIKRVHSQGDKTLYCKSYL